MSREGIVNIKGVVFDMDGVLLDTEKLYVRFWCEAARFYGYNMQKSHALSIRSMARPFVIERLKGFFGENFDYYSVHDKRIELMDAYIEKNGIETKPHALETLEYLKAKGYKTALATATGIEKTEKYLKMTGLYGYLDVIVCASMVKHGKPRPDIYLKACEELGLIPSECMAVEDSENGIISASDAGLNTVLIPDLDSPDKKVEKRRFCLCGCLGDLQRIL